MTEEHQPREHKMSQADGLAPLVIVGPTASGKSSLAVQLARRIPAVEIVSADAMAVYRGMDVGTAKPTITEQGGITHHLIDVADPSEEYTVARFQDDVAAAVASISGRGAVPVVVGGTGLYVRAVVDNFTLPGRFPEVRAAIEREPSTEVLWARLHELDPTAAAKMLPSNRRRIVRALEVTLGAGQPFSTFGPGVDQYPPSPFRQVGLQLERDELDRRIDARYDEQLKVGFLDEVRQLSGQELSRTAAQALGYRELLEHVDGSTTFDEAMDAARKRTKRFARRQERWFRRDPRITWFPALQDDLVSHVEGWWGPQQHTDSLTCKTGFDLANRTRFNVASITLTKHHGLGNDFLIAVQPTLEIGSEDAIRWCDRRRGIGADGLILATHVGEDPAAWAMSLWNADGSRAELSGNGLRCLGQALVLHHDEGGETKRFTIRTDAGPRQVEVLPDRDSDTDQVTVDMGEPTDGPLPYPDWDSVGFPVHQQAGVDVGNPHLVAVVDNPDGIALEKIGPIVEGSYVDGVNIEVIKIVDRSSIRLRVWERGAGLTEACGTGACAAAWAANRWGLVDEKVTVDMPGGSAKIDLVDGGVFLTGPATFVAVVEIEQA